MPGLEGVKRQDHDEREAGIAAWDVEIAEQVVQSQVAKKRCEGRLDFCHLA